MTKQIKNRSDSVQDLRPTVVFGEVTENIVVQVEITQVMNASTSRMINHSQSVQTASPDFLLCCSNNH